MNTYLILLIGMVLWGMFPIVTHYFVREIDPLFLVSISTLASSLPFIVKLLFQKKFKLLFSVKFLRPILPVAIFAAMGHGFLFVGTKLTSGANTGLLLQIEPIYSLILGIIIFGETIGRGQLAATVLMVLGAMTIIYKGEADPNLGDIFILLTPLWYQISHTLAKKQLDQGIDQSLILAARQLIGGLVLLILVVFSNREFIALLGTATVMGSAVYLGFYQSLVTFIWYTVIKRIPLSKASSFLPLTALVALLGSVFFLKETITIQQIAGFVLIAAGMIWQSKIYSTTTTNKV